MARDALGQTLATVIDDMTSGDDKNFAIRLKKPFPLLIDAIAKVSSLALFIMPERLAKTDPYEQVTEMVGSGPFKFVKSEFEPGHRVVYVKNTDYVPRNEPTDWASGGKVVKVDRVEWLYLPEHSTAAAALGSGEVDWWENPPADLWPVLEANPEIVLAPLDPLGGTGCLRFNHLYPPFDNVKMRQAVLMVANQADFMTAYVGDPKNWKLYPSFFTCGTPMAGNAASEALSGKRDFDAAKKLVAEAGYKGEKIVLLDAVDQPLIHAEALVATDLLKKLGLNVEYVTSDWGTVVTRPAIARSRGQRHDAMTPVTSSSHLPPAGEPRFRRRVAVAPPPPTARPTPSISLKSPCRLPRRRQTRHHDRRSAADYAGQRIHNASRRVVKSP
jgi:peptide/nickel transport system substrate-binding protein